jgi:hypothetical protein
MKIYNLLLIAGLISGLQAIRWSPRYWFHHYQGECYDECPEDYMNIITYEKYQGKYLGCLFLKAFDIINPQATNTGHGLNKEQKIKKVLENPGIKNIVIDKMLEYAERDNCTKIDEAMLLNIFKQADYLVYDSLGFGKPRPLYFGSCIRSCDNDERVYLECLFINAAQNLWLNHALQAQIRTGDVKRDLFKNTPKKISNFLKYFYLKIMNAVMDYNKKDLDSPGYEEGKCFEISKNMPEFETIFEKIYTNLLRKLI